MEYGPPCAVERYTLYPVAVALASQLSTMWLLPGEAWRFVGGFGGLDRVTGSSSRAETIGLVWRYLNRTVTSPPDVVNWPVFTRAAFLPTSWKMSRPVRNGCPSTCTSNLRWPIA